MSNTGHSMLPTTPTTGWNIVPEGRRIISPEDSDQGITNQYNNPNQNPFGLLENSNLEDDVSTSSVTSVETAQGDTSASNAVFLVDLGSINHFGTMAYTVDISRQYLYTQLEPTVGTQLEHTILRNQPYIDNILEQYHDTVPDDSLPGLYTPNSNNDDDTVSTASISSFGSMGKDLPSIDDQLGREYQSPEKSNFNFADAVVFREALGNALAGCQHTKRDAGHAYLVDTLKCVVGLLVCWFGLLVLLVLML